MAFCKAMADAAIRKYKYAEEVQRTQNPPQKKQTHEMGL
jgi:hypothetical protein